MPARTKRRFKRFSAKQYHVVVGNPPYITVKDTALERSLSRALSQRLLSTVLA